MHIEDKIRILTNVPLFSVLGEEDIKCLAGTMIERRFSAGEIIFFDGDPSDWYYIVADGVVEILKHAASGKDFVITFLGISEILGQVAVVDGAPYPASARAKVETGTLAIGQHDFRSFMSKHPQLLLRLNGILGKQLRDVQSRLSEFVGEKAQQRLIRNLQMLQSKCGNTLPFTRQEVADMTGISKETTTRIISQLRRRGILGSTRGKIVIMDLPKLNHLVEAHD